jgi:hypothetical protein
MIQMLMIKKIDMEHKIKMLAEAITSAHTKNLIQAHVKELNFNEESQHLIIVLDNAGPLHELSDEEGTHHLVSGLEKIYGENITYQFKLQSDEGSGREKAVPHNINQ